ncbi:hypothetical protein GN958_ATG10348 [Phytophthora infestans]|uniref:Uncharacterized protein n=1 Tax=Phytophthora infestans TaxID=4787 RepID=A0A8S9UQB5_PHYIN|nr:hypothetical protein GN958_ATG10348 [Phytophthora infestans]
MELEEAHDGITGGADDNERSQTDEIAQDLSGARAGGLVGIEMLVVHGQVGARCIDLKSVVGRMTVLSS